MGLLAQGIFGAIGQGADTAAKIMYDDIKAQRDDQLAQANDLRAQNLERQRQQAHSAEAEKQRTFLRDQSDREYNRGPSGVINAETGVPMTRDDVTKTTPDSYMTQKEYDQRNETERAKSIGEAVAPVLKDFAWDAKNPQQSAAGYMQALRSTGQLTEAEVTTEANRMLQAKMPKDGKLQVATIPVGDGREQSVIVNLADGTYTPMGKPGPKFAPEKSGLAGSGRLTENQAAANILKLSKKMGEGEDLTADEEMLMDASRKRLGKDKKLSVKDFQGSGETMPIPEKGGLIATANASSTAPAKAQKMKHEDVDAQAQAAIMQVYANKKLTPAQQQQKIAAINARRNSLVGG